MEEGELIEGSLLYHKYEDNEVCKIVTSYLSNEEGESRALAYDVLPETVCQYTGINDGTKWRDLSKREKEKFLSEWNHKEGRQNTKEDWNGRKIFEGDIVRDIFNASVIGIVRYGEYRNTFNDDEHGGHVGFYVEWKEKKDFLRKDLVYWAKNSEFIGNIFDNPEPFRCGTV